MLNFIRNISTVILVVFSNISLANTHLVDANILYAIPDAGGNDDFRTGKIIQANYNYYILPWMTITGGVFFSEEIFDDIQKDIVGTYRASIQTEGITLGIRPEHQFSQRNKVYGRIGILYYNTKLSIEEQIEPASATDTSRGSTSGNGYFVSLGWSHSFNDSISFQLELFNQTQLKLFNGKTDTDNVFDLSSSGFTLGLSYGF